MLTTKLDDEPVECYERNIFYALVFHTDWIRTAIVGRRTERLLNVIFC